MADKDVVLYEKKGHIVTITMNRPERLNALNPALYEGLRNSWVQYREDDDAWVAILTAAGEKSFCAGNDLREMNDQKSAGTYKLPRPGSWVVDSPRGLKIYKPSIAAVNGFALAGGFMMAQDCDLVVAAEEAEFAITEPRWNLSGSWCAPLTRQVSLRHAIEMTIVPWRISARRAYEMGFVNWVVPRAQLMQKAMQVAEAICENGPASVSAFLETYHRTYGMPAQEAIELGDHIQKHLRHTEDAKEGPRAFVEKRKPNWQNK